MKRGEIFWQNKITRCAKFATLSNDKSNKWILEIEKWWWVSLAQSQETLRSGVLSDAESLMTLWNDFNFALTEPQKDYLNEQNEFKLLTLKINDLDKAIKLTKWKNY